MKRDKTIYHEYNMAKSQLGHIPVIIKKLISELDTSSLYYEKNKKDLERALRVTQRAFTDIQDYDITY